jgi:phosphate transport system substrate-binding protein
MFAIAVVTALCATWCAGQVATASAASITMSGSTSIAPLATKLARGYVNTRQGDGTAFRITQGGSDIGINDVARGRVSIGMSSRDPKPADPGGIVFYKVARDAICIVTNRRNPIANMSRKMIQDIFSGRRRSWRQVTGSRANGPIDLVVRTAASGTQDAFQNIFMGQSLRVAGSASTESSNGLQAQAIKSNPNAIGYASFNFTRGLFVVPYKGVPCTLRNAKSGQYRGARNFYFVTRGQPRGERKQFLNWVKGSRAASRIIASNWVPLR